MEDERVWAHEERLWSGATDAFARGVDASCLIVVPAAPFVMEGAEAVNAIAQLPRWQAVSFAHGRIARPQDGLIVAAYKATANRENEENYTAWCTSTYRRVAHDDWRLVQHQQMHAADGPLRGG